MVGDFDLDVGVKPSGFRITQNNTRGKGGEPKPDAAKPATPPPAEKKWTPLTDDQRHLCGLLADIFLKDRNSDCIASDEERNLVAHGVDMMERLEAEGRDVEEVQDIVIREVSNNYWSARRGNAPTAMSGTGCGGGSFDVGRIKASVPISSVFEALGVEVCNGRAVAIWRGGERKSVSVDDEQGLWHDFVTDEAGDAIAIVQRVYGCDFREACEWLCKRFNIEAEVSRSSVKDRYEYTDENGNPLFFVIRKVPKDFRQGHYDEDGHEVWNMKGVRRVPYRLPQLIEGVRKNIRIFVVEGEKDVESVERLGLCATCNPGGAGKWRDEYSAFFKGADVVTIIADRDGEDAPNPQNSFNGQRHAENVRESLERVAGVRASIVYVGDDGCKDASDWIAKGATGDDFNALADNPPPWVPPWQDTSPGNETARDDEPTATEDSAPLDWNDIINELPGLVGEIARYALSTMIRPQPKFAVLIALVTVATVYNRTVHDSANNIARVFGMAICPNGGGKDPVLKIPPAIIEAALLNLGWHAQLIMSKAHSESAIADAISFCPVRTMLIDEVSGFFKQAKAAEKSGASIATVKSMLKTLYSFKLGETYEGAKNARVQGKSLKRIRVDTPCVSFAGVTQDDMLPEAFQEADIKDGLLPRNIFFISETRPRKNYDVLASRPPIPETIIDAIAKVLEMQRWEQADKDDPNAKTYSYKYKSHLLRASAEAQAKQREYGDSCDNRFEEMDAAGKLTASIWVRADENARGIALVIAAGRAGVKLSGAEISLSDVELAIRIVTACANDACRFLEGRITDDRFDALKLKIRRFIHKAGEAGRTQTEITRGKFGDPKYRDIAIKEEVAAGYVKASQVCRKGRTAIAYFITKRGAATL